ncbi:MAG: type II secretion system protein [Pseudomonadota bacterium]
MRRNRPSEVAGFSLLEAIVALAILSAAGLALFAAIAQSVHMAERAERAREADTAMRNALAWSERINPMEQPRGEQLLGDYRLRWTSEAVEPERDAVTGHLQPGLYRVGLYRLRMQLWRDGAIAEEVERLRVGYRQVREAPRL